METASEIAARDESDLTPVVARLLHTGRARVVTFEAEPIGYKRSNPVSAALVRFHGTAVVHGEPRPWSLVLKALRDPGETEWNARRFARCLDPAARARLGRVGRWDREVNAYASGMLADLGDGRKIAFVVERAKELERLL